LRARALAGGGLGIGTIEIALSEVKRDLIQRALFPFFGLCQPEDFALRIAHRTLSANEFLAANLDQLFHELHSRGVKPICPTTIAELWPNASILLWEKMAASLPDNAGGIAPQYLESKAQVPLNAVLLDSRRQLPQHFVCCT
jgi:hypothetical protein